MTFGSLFAGIGGFDLGLERAGMECRWQVEIDPFCRKVLAKHWPDVPRYEDVTDVGAHILEPVDLICGGFPCQDISASGRGEGIEGERSGLWSEFARVIFELRPRYAILENSPMLTARGLGRVLGDLAEIGYDAEWECIPAWWFGAPHKRARLFVVAHADGFGCEGSPFGSDALRQLERGAPTPFRVPVPSEPPVSGVDDGVPDRVDRNHAIGNAVVPQVAEWIGRRIMEAA